MPYYRYDWLDNLKGFKYIYFFNASHGLLYNMTEFTFILNYIFTPYINMGNRLHFKDIEAYHSFMPASTLTQCSAYNGL